MNTRITSWLLLPLLIAACAGPEQKAQELMKNAAFEELQGNIPYASKLYQRVVEAYPETEAAKQAQQRLEELATVD